MTTTIPTVGYFRHPPVDPVLGCISAEDNSILLGQVKHNEAPDIWKRKDCDRIFHDHWFLDMGDGLHVTICPDGVGTPQPDLPSFSLLMRRLAENDPFAQHTAP